MDRGACHRAWSMEYAMEHVKVLMKGRADMGTGADVDSGAGIGPGASNAAGVNSVAGTVAGSLRAHVQVRYI